jgi:thiol-disulfide isomerase/thioredoxin
MGIYKKTVCAAFLVILFILATGLNALGDQYVVGSGNDDWWTTYPDQSPGKGKEVNHPAWILDALKSKPVLVYVHGGCDYCKPQTEALAKVVDEMGKKFAYYDIPSGSDERAGEALQAYDPNGGQMYLPLTVLITRTSNSEGKVVPVWHSTDQITGEDWIKSYLVDAISHYNENSGK